MILYMHANIYMKIAVDILGTLYVSYFIVNIYEFLFNWDFMVVSFSAYF